jgi:endonuclease III
MDGPDPMATTTIKQRLVSQIFSQLAAKCKADEAPARPVLEEFVYAILREGHTRDAADQAFEALKKNFFDWNEIRVSMTEEIVAVIGQWTTDAERRAQRIIDFLQEVFESTFSFDLEGLDKKGVKQAGKTLARYQAASDYTIAWVTQKSLGGHALPLDSGALRSLRRLKLIEENQNDLEVIRSSLEHQIPKAKGHQFVDLISYLAQEHCWEEDPACPQCPLRAGCPTGMNAKPAKATKKPR